MENIDCDSEMQRYYKEFKKFIGQCNGVIISDTGESALKYEQQLIRALIKKNPEIRIFNVDGWKRKNPGQDVHESTLEYVNRGPEFIVVLMNKPWQYKDRDQAYMKMVFDKVLDKSKTDTFIPVIIDDNNWDVNFNENYDETTDGKKWMTKFNQNVYKTSDSSWIEKVVNVARQKKMMEVVQTKKTCGIFNHHFSLCFRP